MDFDQATENLKASNLAQKEREKESLSNDVARISNLLGKTQAQFQQFDIVNETKSEELTAISDQSEHLKAIVDGLSKVREASDGSFTEQRAAAKHLKELQKGIEKNTSLSVEQRNLLQEQASTLKQGFSSTNALLEQSKKVLADYSDAAIVGFTSLLGNSPATMMLTKIATDNAKAFFARRKEQKEQKAKLVRAEAIDNQKLKQDEENVEKNKSTSEENISQTKTMKLTRDITLAKWFWEKRQAKKQEKIARKIRRSEQKNNSIASQISEESNREESSNEKGKSGSKFKSKSKKWLKILQRIFLYLFAAFGLLVTGIKKYGLAITAGAVAIGTAFAALVKSIGKAALNLLGFGPKKAPVKPTTVGGGKAPKKKVPKKPLMKKVASKGVSAAKTGVRVLGRASAVGGAALAGYEAGTLINDNLLTNEDGSGKIANFAYDNIHGSDEERNKKYEEDLAIAREKSGSATASKLPRRPDMSKVDSMSIRANVVNLEQMSAERRSAATDSVVESRREIDIHETNKREKSSQTVVSQSTNNSSTNNVIAIPQASNPDDSFIRASRDGAL